MLGSRAQAHEVTFTREVGMSAEHEALDQFGQLLMNRVRDAAIKEWDGIFHGCMKDTEAQEIHTLLTSFGEEQQALLLRLVPKIVDTALHHLLWALEQTEWVDLGVKAEAGTVARLQDVTDSLCWELHGDEGWISRFSKERYEIIR
jgi:hypothetical protein